MAGQYHDANLTKSMEHLRPYVSVPSQPSPAPPTDSLASDGQETYGVPAALINPVRKPPQRPRSPSNTQKRTDPFQFGSRLLEEGDDIFEFNAWDHVETDDAYKEFAELQYQRQRESPVSDFDKNRFNSAPEKFWNKFYSHNSSNFFKDRKWLFQEFPSLARATGEDSPPVTILEVGAGAGNTAFPILAANKNPGLKVHACDFSSTAVDVIRRNPAYDIKYIQADVWDVAAINEVDGGTSMPPNVKPGSVDIVVLIFIFSALAPSQWDQALLNIWTVLKPGGEVLFRDYGRGDLAQVRFKKGRWLEDNFYIRGDGTRVYFFEKEELESIWSGTRKGEADTSETVASVVVPKFDVLNLGVDRRMLVNRQRKLKMYRCWMQGRYQKPTAQSETTS